MNAKVKRHRTQFAQHPCVLFGYVRCVCELFCKGIPKIDTQISVHVTSEKIKGTVT